MAVLQLTDIITADFINFRDYFEKTKVDGLIMEFGVASGGTLKEIANGFKDKTVYGFDWFEGLPEDWREGISKGSFKCDIPSDLPTNAELVVGLFEESLPKFLETHLGPAAFIHIDCDLYSSTKTVFDNLKDRIVDGTIIVFDEIVSYEGYEEHEFKAFNEFLKQNDFKYECLGRHVNGEKAGFRVFK